MQMIQSSVPTLRDDVIISRLPKSLTHGKKVLHRAYNFGATKGNHSEAGYPHTIISQKSAMSRVINEQVFRPIFGIINHITTRETFPLSPFPPNPKGLSGAVPRVSRERAFPFSSKSSLSFKALSHSYFRAPQPKPFPVPGNSRNLLACTPIPTVAKVAHISNSLT